MLAIGTGMVVPSHVRAAPAAAAAPRWITGWSASPLDVSGPPAPPPGPHWPPVLNNVSLRQRVALAATGERVRVRFSNVFGKEALHIAAATVANVTGEGALAASSMSVLRFGERPTVTIAPGAEVWSDPVALPERLGSELAVSFHFDRPTRQRTVHSVSHDLTNKVAGNLVAAPQWSGAVVMPWSHVVTGVDVETRAPTRVLVAFGDSITEGGGGTLPRYPELLAARLRGPAAHPRRGAGRVDVSVQNAGIAGNRLLVDGTGPRGLDRFARDVLSQSGVTHTLILIGINDIGYSATPGLPDASAPGARQVVAGLQQLVEQANARGVKVLLGTLPPFKGARIHTPETEGKRRLVNEWIRSSPRKAYAVVDFDRALRDGADPLKLQPRYDSGDHLHPSVAGRAAMAGAVDLNLLR
ncbi:MAG: lipolytic protein family [Variovorax sp.]|nr:lipolytic protein family [Variovorax sp.]